MLDDDRDRGPGHDTWVPVDAAPIKVNVESLKDYSLLLVDELKKDFNVNVKEGITPMLHVFSTFGGTGEGKLYRGAHGKATMAAGMMLKDLGLCLTSLSQAAASIYFEYIGGDDLGKATTDDVYDAFYPGPGMQTVQGAAAGPEPAPAAGTDDKQGQSRAGDTTDSASDPARLDGDGTPTTFASYDDGFTVGEGTKGQYVVNDNQTDMVNTPDDPLLKK